MARVRRPTGYKRLEVAAASGWRCAACGEMLQAAFEVDHIVPICYGGRNDPRNLQALCCNCHGRKSARERAGGPGGVECFRCDNWHSPYFRCRCSRHFAPAPRLNG